MNRSEVAVATLLRGYNCAQAIFSAFADGPPIDRELALRTASGFGAGMGRKGEVCGAVTGGILVLGARYGRGEQDGREATEETYRKTRELMDRFVERHGTYLCRTLLEGCDLMTAEGQRQFRDGDRLNTTCRPCVESVVAIVETML